MIMKIQVYAKSIIVSLVRLFGVYSSLFFLDGIFEIYKKQVISRRPVDRKRDHLLWEIGHLIEFLNKSVAKSRAFSLSSRRTI